MNILVLHRDNVPLSLRSQTPFWESKDVFITSHPFVLPQTDVPDYDTFVSDELDKLELYKYDLFVLPLDLSESYMEYTGLRVAAHIRLTPKWRSLTTPILFLCIEKVEDIVRFASLGEIVNSYSVFCSSRTEQDDLLKCFYYIDKSYSKTKWSIEDFTNSPEYQSFLLRMRCIQAPANYASHHSLANEWAIMRWNDMMTNHISMGEKDFTKMLYYKYLRTTYGNGQQLNKWRRDNPYIEKIAGIDSTKRLILIDDEWEKGWSDILSYIASVSGYQFDYCKIDKKWDRTTLIREVKQFVSDNDHHTDCYLLDLRLHDTDFDETYLKQNKLRLSGYDILDYIKSCNKANPIIIFSASNKVWNLKNAVRSIGVSSNNNEGAIDYVLKETPESALKATESYKLYCDFVNSIRISFKLSELKKIVVKQRELTKISDNVEPLNEFVNLAILDKGKNNNSMLKSCLMTLMTFVEDYIKDRFELIETGDKNAKRIQLTWTKSYSNTTINGDVTKHVFVKRKQIESSSRYYIEDSYYSEDPTEPMDLYGKISSKGDIGILLSVLYIQYRFNDHDINTFFLPLKRKRNAISHESKKISLSYDELYDFYFKIIVPIIEHDNKNVFKNKKNE